MKVIVIVRRYWFVTVLLLCGIGMGIGYFQQVALRRNYIVTSGIINVIDGSSKGGGVFVSYTFEANNFSYNGKNAIPNSNSHFPSEFSFLKGQRLSVVYSSRNIRNSKMLFLAKDYNDFGITIPIQFDTIVRNIHKIID